MQHTTEANQTVPMPPHLHRRPLRQVKCRAMDIGHLPQDLSK